MHTYSFTEQAPYEQGFARVFQDRIAPILDGHEQERLKMRKKALMGMGAGGTVGVGSAGGGIAVESEYGIFGAVIGGIGAFGAKSYFEGQWRAGLGGEVLPILCEFLGEMSYGDQRINLSEFSNVGVLPNYDRSHLEDPVAGTHDGLNWAMTEAKLEKRTRDSKGRTKTTTVFRGLLFKIQINGPAPRIFFGRDRGGTLNWLSETFSSSRRGLEKVHVPDPAFEDIYETYSDNPTAALQFIDGRLTSGLLEVAKTESGKKYISCAMEGDGLYLAMPRSSDFLGLGSLFRPLTTIDKDLHEALADLTMPGRVI
ncbi:MAG: DUF3137 domain-containing protein, partial [Pseudomonadota bacterium]